MTARRRAPRTALLTTIPVVAAAMLLIAPSGARAATTPSTTSKGFVVRTPGKTAITVRSAPDSTAPVVGHLPNGSKLAIACQTKGTTVHDATTNHSSLLWDKLSTGGYVSNLYTTAYRATGPGYTPGLTGCPATKARVTSAKSPATSPTKTDTKTAPRTVTKTTVKAQPSTARTAKSGVTVNLLPTPVGAAATVTTTAP